MMMMIKIFSKTTRNDTKRKYLKPKIAKHNNNQMCISSRIQIEIDKK